MTQSIEGSSNPSDQSIALETRRVSPLRKRSSTPPPVPAPAVDMLSGNPVFPAKTGKAFRKRAEREERHEALALGEVSRNYVSDPLPGVVRFHVPDFVRVKIAGDRMHVAKVYPEGDRLDADPAQVAVANQVNQGCLVGVWVPWDPPTTPGPVAQ